MSFFTFFRLVDKAPAMDRLARFILDWADSSSTTSSGYTSDSGKTANLFNLGLDTQAIGDVSFASYRILSDQQQS